MDPVQILVRLTLLAILTTTYKISGRKIPYLWIAGELERAYGDVVAVLGKRWEDEKLQIWVLMVAAISVAGDEMWMGEAVRGIRKMAEWEHVKSVLVDMVWIECTHDVPGRKAVEGFQRRVAVEA